MKIYHWSRERIVKNRVKYIEYVKLNYFIIRTIGGSLEYPDTVGSLHDL